MKPYQEIIDLLQGHSEKEFDEMASYVCCIDNNWQKRRAVLIKFCMGTRPTKKTKKDIKGRIGLLREYDMENLAEIIWDMQIGYDCASGRINNLLKGE